MFFSESSSWENPSKIAKLINESLNKNNLKHISIIIKKIPEGYLDDKKKRDLFKYKCGPVSWFYVLIKLIENAFDDENTKAVNTYTKYFYNTFTANDLQKNTFNDKNLYQLIWETPEIAAHFLYTWVHSPEKMEKWRQKARLIFKAIPKEYPNKEEYSGFLPDIIVLCHKNNICGENKIMHLPDKFFKDKNKNHDVDNIERVLKNLSINQNKN